VAIRRPRADLGERGAAAHLVGRWPRDLLPGRRSAHVRDAGARPVDPGHVTSATFQRRFRTGLRRSDGRPVAAGSKRPRRSESRDRAELADGTAAGDGYEMNRIGPYDIVSKIGAGGMGEVYRARDDRLKRDVAIKVLPPSLADDRERLLRFEREAQTLA